MIIISAAEFEAQPTLDVLHDAGIEHEFFACGIGALNAARASVTLAKLCVDSDVVFIGTCGAFSSFVDIEVYRATRVRWLPVGVRHGLGYTVKDSAPDIVLPSPLVQFESISTRQVMCAPTISTNADLPEEYFPEDWVENLELFSVAQPIIEQANSFTALLAVTNSICTEAHEQWQENQAAAADLIAACIKSEL